MDYVCLTASPPLPLPKGPELCLSTKSKLRLGGDVRRFVRIRKEAAPPVNRLFCPDFRAPDGSIPSTPSSPSSFLPFYPLLFLFHSNFQNLPNMPYNFQKFRSPSFSTPISKIFQTRPTISYEKLKLRYLTNAITDI